MIIPAARERRNTRKETRIAKGSSISKRDPFLVWILLGIPLLFIAAYPIHFLYGWVGKSVVMGVFAPVNESAWEHLKLAFWPMLIWWIVGYLLFLRKKEGGLGRAAVTFAAAGLLCVLIIEAFYYIHTGAFGFKSLAFDITSLFVGLLTGILLARHIYKHTKPGKFAAFLAIVLILVMTASFVYFTFDPPHLPIFRDPPTGLYGILK
jgi:hypothetical protein